MLMLVVPEPEPDAGDSVPGPDTDHVNEGIPLVIASVREAVVGPVEVAVKLCEE